MAFASYFAKNEIAASDLLRGLDPSALRVALDREVVAIVFDGSAAVSHEGIAGLDLTIRILARLYPSLAIIGSDEGQAKKLRAALARLAMQINPAISIRQSLNAATRVLVFGRTPVDPAGKLNGSIWYVGSDNWIAKVSTTHPVRCGSTKNPFGAGVAACLGTANLFRKVFSAHLPGDRSDRDIQFSVATLGAKVGADTGPRLTARHLGPIHLVGAGAIGNGFLWAMRQARGSGKIHVIDPDAVDATNLQRYVMTVAKDEGAQKAKLADAWLKEHAANGFRVMAHPVSWEGFLDGLADWTLPCVVSAVDSAEARITIQASLPERIFNGWTQAGEAGVSRHHFLGRQACLACLYIPRQQQPHRDQLVLRALKLPEDEVTLKDVRRRLQQGTPTERAFLDVISQHSGVSVDCLLPYEGTSLEAMYTQAICSGAVLALHGADNASRAEVPMAFQSALAGILLAADLVLEREPWPTVTQIDLLRPFPRDPSHNRLKQASPVCLCADRDFQDAYRTKYPLRDTC